MELALPFSLEALCTYYLSEWQMFFKWWCLMCAELLPKPYRERLPDVIHHLMVETSTDWIPLLRGSFFSFFFYCREGEQQRKRLSGWSAEGIATPYRVTAGSDPGLGLTVRHAGSTETSESTAKIRSSELNFSERCEYVWVAEANIIYSRDININIDRKQICKWLCQCSLPQTEHKEGGHFAMCIF